LAQRGISLAGLIEENTAATRLLLQSQLQKFVNPLPAFRLHRSSDE
jgi:hypothetical protein